MCNKLKTLYENALGQKAESIVRLVAAGSNRQYYRIISPNGDTLIGVVGTSREENDAFLFLSQHFEEKGLNVPKIIAVSDDHMQYIISDLGDTSLFSIIKQGDLSLMESTIKELIKIQVFGGEGLDYSICYPQSEFDRENVLFDLNYFKYCFLKTTGIDFHELRLQKDFYHLANDLCEYSVVKNIEGREINTFMYRDFQSRNVLVKDGKPCFIDYQGGRRGPIYYDLASFLWQASIDLDDEVKEHLIDAYYDEMQKYILLADKEEFLHRLRLFVFFRTMQVLGAYGFRGYFERKQHFIDSISPALKNLEALLKKNVADNYPELNATLHDLVEQHKQKLKEKEKRTHLVVRIFSFSYKKGIPQDESGNGGGYVFDCRSTHNPGRYAQYKHSTGLDEDVIHFLEEDGEIKDFLESVYALADHHVERYLQRDFTDLMFSFGCTGGQHRSVYSAQHLAEHLNEKYGIEVHLCHREQGINQTLCKR